MQECFSSGVRGVQYPFIALLDYRGFRLVCMSILPIGEDSLVCGSDDAGKHVHWDAGFGEIINKIGKSCRGFHLCFSTLSNTGEKLNLRAHVISESGIISRGPIDLEGHVGSDGNRYLLDFARMMPPSAITQYSPIL